MEHIAIDLGGRESQICVRSASGEILEERKHATRTLGRYLRRRPASRVVLETCAEAFNVADAVLELGHEVRVVPASLVGTLGVGSRGLKTDKRDARILSEVSCRIDLPSVHVPKEESRRRKTMCGMREQLIGARTQLINCVRGWLRGRALRVRTGAIATFAARVRSASVEIPVHVERLLLSIEQLTEQIREADHELQQLVKSDPLLQRLSTVPGVGPVTTVRFAASIDDVTRFENAHQLESYLGLVPGERQSSTKQHRLGITKAGSSAVRRLLIQAAWAVRRVRSPQPMREWARKIEERRGKFIATVALARKLAGILYALWRDGTTYQAQRSAGPQPTSS
jgi:transposase